MPLPRAPLQYTKAMFFLPPYSNQYDFDYCIKINRISAKVALGSGYGYGLQYMYGFCVGSARVRVLFGILYFMPFVSQQATDLAFGIWHYLQ